MQARELFSLEDRPVAITGAGGLLGVNHAIAVGSAGGFPILLEADSMRLEQASKLMEDMGIEFLAFQLDTTNEKDLRAVAEETRSAVGPIFGMVNNVAANPQMSENRANFGHLESITSEEWIRDHQVALSSSFLMAKVFGPQLVDRREGSIINISSDLGAIAPDHRVYSQGIHTEDGPRKPLSYSSIKSATLGISRYLATYWAPLPIRSNAILPGSVQTNQSDSMIRELTARIPLNRLARPEDYQGAVVFLLSDASAFMTGSELIIDGGRSCW